MKSMSLTSSFPLHVRVTSSTSFVKHVNKIEMLRHNQVPNKKNPTLRIRSFSRNKVFEDQSRGVICYIDENGEMVCEGYDEGPRFQIPGTFYHLRDAEILDLLQDRWLQIVNGADGLGNANKGLNDINKFH